MAIDWSQYSPVDPTTPKGRGVDWSQFEPIKKDDSDLTRGVKESFQQLPQLGYGLVAGAGAAGEAAFGSGGIWSGVKKAGVSGYQEWGDKIAANAKPSDSWNYSWEAAKQGDFGALVDWLQHGIGYVGGQGLQMLATAGIGAIGGKVVASTAAKQIAEGMVAKEAAKLGAESAGKLTAEQIAAQATANVAEKFAAVGMNAAMGATAVGMEGGEIFGDLSKRSVEEGRTLTGAELGKAFAATLAAGGLEFVGDRLGLDIVLGKSPFLKPAAGMAGIGGRVARGAIAAAAQSPIEAGTEYAQTLFEEYGKGNSPFSEQSLKQASDAAALGALGGTVIGGAGGMVQGPTMPAARPGEKQPSIFEAALTPISQGPQTSASDQALGQMAAAKTADELIDGALRAADVPLTGVTKRLADDAMGAMEAQSAGDERAIRYGGQPTAAPRWNLPRGQTELGDEIPFGDRILALREQLADPQVRETLRTALGPEAFDTVHYYASIADRTDIDLPGKTRERLIGLAEGIVDRVLFQPVDQPAASTPAGLLEPPVRRIGLDTSPTGRMRVNSSGNVAPETRADVISGLRRRADGMEQVVPRGAQPAPAQAAPRPKADIKMPARTPRADAAEIDAAAPNAVRQFVERMRGVNTPAAHAFVQDFESGRITAQDVLELMVPPSRGPSADERLADAAAEAEVQKPRPTDILTADGFPYGTVAGAKARAAREGLTPANVIEVAGGYAVRKEPASAQPDVASAAGVDAGARTAGPGDAAGSIRTVRPVADDAKRATGPDPGPAGTSGAAGVQPGRGSDAGGALTTRQRIDAMRKPPPTLSDLKTQWRQAVQAGDTERAKQINDQIVAAKSSEQTALPTEKLARLVDLTGRDRAEVAKQYSGFVSEHGREMADQMLDQAINAAEPVKARRDAEAKAKDEIEAAAQAAAKTEQEAKERARQEEEAAAAARAAEEKAKQEAQVAAERELAAKAEQEAKAASEKRAAEEAKAEQQRKEDAERAARAEQEDRAAEEKAAAEKNAVKTAPEESKTTAEDVKRKTIELRKRLAVLAKLKACLDA